MNFKLIEFLIVFTLYLSIWNKQSNAESTDGQIDIAIDDCPNIVSRKRWGSRTAKNIVYQIFPVKYVIIHHTVTPTCDTKLKCSNLLLSIQNYNMDNLDGDDIPYNFIISDNEVYEGTGWHVRGAHTYGYNSNSTGIAFMGTFSEKLPTITAIEATKKLLRCGVKLGELDRNYILLGARQVIATESPGLEFYVELQDWDHWSSLP